MLQGNKKKMEAYVGNIRLANIDDWQISKDVNNRRLRDAAYGIQPQRFSNSSMDHRGKQINHE